jgi:hypothetical protein
MNYSGDTRFLTCRSGFSVSLEGDAVKATRLLTLRIDGHTSQRNEHYELQGWQQPCRRPSTHTP